MSISDLIKNKFVEEFTAISVGTLLTTLLLSFALGLFVLVIYRVTFGGVSFSKSFALSLVMLSMVTALAILTVRSNVVLSLGMVGALSIVRFRTAIKEPMDIAFLFWSIAVGIVLAAGLLFLAVLGSAFVGLVLWWFARRRGGESPYILVLHCADAQTEDAAKALVDSAVKKWNLKSKSVTPGQIELNYEVRLRAGDAAFVNTLGELDGVTNVVLVSYNGDYMG